MSHKWPVCSELCSLMQGHTSIPQGLTSNLARGRLWIPWGSLADMIKSWLPVTNSWKDGRCQHVASFLLVLVVLGTRSNKSKDNLCDLLPISSIPPKIWNSKIAKYPNIQISKCPNIQMSKYPNSQILKFPKSPNSKFSNSQNHTSRGFDLCLVLFFAHT